MTTRKIDPLQKILERYLIQLSPGDKLGQTALDSIVNEYFDYLSNQGVHIPGPVRQVFIQDTKEEIKELAIQATMGTIVPEADGTPTSGVKVRKVA